MITKSDFIILQKWAKTTRFPLRREGITSRYMKYDPSVCYVKFGKNKILPSISPKKSWEGFIGGMIITVILTLLYCLYNEESYINYLLMAIIIPFLATLGDFIESAYKREAGVKDSGNLIPGHGGMLDRMDSLLITISFSAIIIIIN